MSVERELSELRQELAQLEREVQRLNREVFCPVSDVDEIVRLIGMGRMKEADVLLRKGKHQ